MCLSTNLSVSPSIHPSARLVNLCVSVRRGAGFLLSPLSLIAPSSGTVLGLCAFRSWSATGSALNRSLEWTQRWKLLALSDLLGSLRISVTRFGETWMTASRWASPSQVARCACFPASTNPTFWCAPPWDCAWLWEKKGWCRSLVLKPMLESVVFTTTTTGHTPRDKKREFDFLSSLEIVILDQADDFVMQNWVCIVSVFMKWDSSGRVSSNLCPEVLSQYAMHQAWSGVTFSAILACFSDWHAGNPLQAHVEAIMNAINGIPSEDRGTDFSRVRNYLLDGQASAFRSLLVFCKGLTVDIHNLFLRHAKNILLSPRAPSSFSPCGVCLCMSGGSCSLGSVSP